MILADRYEIEVLRDPEPRRGVMPTWQLMDPNGVIIAEVPGDWNREQVEAFLDGCEQGLKQGREQGRQALLMELHALLGLTRSW